MKTTPNPRATKKSNGELLGPPPPPLPLVEVLVAAEVELVTVEVVDDISWMMREIDNRDVYRKCGDQGPKNSSLLEVLLIFLA